MRRAVVLTGSVLIGLALGAGPSLAHAGYPCRCDGCSDDWDSGGGRGYYAGGGYDPGYSYWRHRAWRLHRHHHYLRSYRRYHRYDGYGYSYGYRGYGRG